mgnify:CR=1 FL=1
MTNRNKTIGFTLYLLKFLISLCAGIAAGYFISSHFFSAPPDNHTSGTTRTAPSGKTTVFTPAKWHVSQDSGQSNCFPASSPFTVKTDFSQDLYISCPIKLPASQRIQGISGRIRFHRLPVNDIKALMFFKDKDGTWFQSDEILNMKNQKEVHFNVSMHPQSSLMAGIGHDRIWNAFQSGLKSTVGIKFFSNTASDHSFTFGPVQIKTRSPEVNDLQILDYKCTSGSVPCHGLFEISFRLSQTVANPFNPDNVKIDGIFIDPDFSVIRIPGFFFQDYTRRLKNKKEFLTPSGAPCWKIRHTPQKPGQYKYKISVTVNGKQIITDFREFTCVKSDRKGFIGLSDHNPRYFAFSDGTFFYPVGHNYRSPNDIRSKKKLRIPLAPNMGTHSYEANFVDMARAGENFVEIWMCSWWLALEWTSNWKYYHGLSKYNMQNAWKLDRIIDEAAKKGIYLNLVIDNHGKYSEWCDEEWDNSPYNTANKGFLSRSEDFFKDPKARRLHKRKLRYIAGRWGYSTNILGFCFISESNLMGSKKFKHDSRKLYPLLRRWHKEMFQYFKVMDNYRHLVTTHYSGDYKVIDKIMAGMKELDYITGDGYRKSGCIVDIIKKTHYSLKRYNKPFLITEFGGNWNAGSHELLIADLHAGLWSSFMTDAAGSPLFWWFHFIKVKNLYPHYRAFTAFIKGEDKSRLNLNMKSFPVFEAKENIPTGKLDCLATGNKSRLLGWIYSPKAMYHFKGKEAARFFFPDTRIKLRGLDPGKYRVEIWNTYTGEITTESTIAIKSSEKDLDIPPFYNDTAFKVYAIQ